MKLLLGVVMLALGCGSKTPKTLEGICPKPGTMCNTFTCGGNSAVINAFPVNGMRPGECSPEGIKLMPGSLDGPCPGQTLDIDDQGRLVGKNADGTIGCVEAALKGTTFEVGSHAGTERVEITDVITDWKPPTGEARVAYRMEWTKETEHDAAGRRKGLCGKEGQKLRKALHIKEMLDSDDLPDAEAELVIPVVSEVYDELGELTKSDPWNHLACVDDALAKRKFYKLEDTAGSIKNQTALRMLTADYCGATAWTVRGEWIEWANENDAVKVEAQWDENGAKCLTAPRLLRDDNDNIVEPPKKTKHLLDRLCKNPNKCTTVAEWMDSMRKCRDKVGNVVRELKDCAECKGTNCPLASKNAKHP